MSIANASSPSKDHLSPKQLKSEKKSRKEKKEKSKKRKRSHIEGYIEGDREDAREKEISLKKLNTQSRDPVVLTELTSGKNSPFCRKTISLYLSLSPISQLHPLQGVCAEHLSSLILTYYRPVKGIVLSYDKVRLSESLDGSSENELQRQASLAKSIEDYPVSFVWTTIDFLVFEPRPSCWIEGWINLQNEGHIGLVCWNLFNARIERARLPKTWKWRGLSAKPNSTTRLKGGEDEGAAEDEDEEIRQGTATDGVQHETGHFEDANGDRIEGVLKFRVKDIETSMSTDREKGFLNIEGTLLSEKDEEELAREDFNLNLGKGSVRPLRRGNKSAIRIPNGTVDSRSKPRPGLNQQ